MSTTRKFIQAEIIYGSLLSILIILYGFLPSQGFDDVFLTENGLLPYVDFRPGYPPLGKLPYHFLFRLFSLTIAYNLVTFMFNLAALLLLGMALVLCLSKIQPKRAFVIALIFLMMPSVIYFSVTHAHADTLAVSTMLFALYFLDYPWASGALCAVGALIKFYPAFFIIPLFLYQKGIKRKICLVYSFSFFIFLFSIPFLLTDPLMYLSVALSHTFRSPSESIFALIDGYYGHTGFLHPTFDASFYSWQFATLYKPNSYDHFRYQWNIPMLPYVSLALQLVSMISISWIARKKESRREAMMLISLAMFSYFAFSTFYNPIIHIPQICFLALATANWSKRTQISTLAAFETVNALHSLVWFSPTFLLMGIMLPLSIAIILRTVLYILVFLNFARRKSI